MNQAKYRRRFDPENIYGINLDPVTPQPRSIVLASLRVAVWFVALIVAAGLWIGPVTYLSSQFHECCVVIGFFAFCSDSIIKILSDL